jgi:hypothetical protein
LFVPNATLVDVDVDGDVVVAVGLLEQADTKTKVAINTMGATALDRRDKETRIGAILRGGLGADQGLS